MISERELERVEYEVNSIEPEVAELNAGEVVIFSQMLVHRSGVNGSELPRLTCQLRFSDRSHPNFIANVNRPGHDVEVNLPTNKDMARIF